GRGLPADAHPEHAARACHAPRRRRLAVADPAVARPFAALRVPSPRERRCEADHVTVPHRASARLESRGMSTATREATERSEAVLGEIVLYHAKDGDDAAELVAFPLCVDMTTLAAIVTRSHARGMDDPR